MINFLTPIFSIEPFIPHGHCYLWKPGLVGLHVAADALIAIAYYSIPLTLFHFTRQRQDLPFKQIFVLFGAFILFCGTTHLLEIWTLWHPIYWLSGGVKAITALISVLTAIELVPLIPQFLALPNPAELQRLNDQLQTSQARFAGILENASDAIISIDPHQRITSFNRAAEKLFGYTADEALGHPLHLLLPKRFVELHHHHVSTFFQAETNSTRPMNDQREIFGRRKDGTEFPAAASISRLDVAGEKICTTFLRDISEQQAAFHKRQQTEASLRQSEERWHLAVSGSNDGIWDHNLQTNEHYLSPRCMEILGYEYHEIDTFAKWLQFIHPDDRPRLQTTFQTHVEQHLPNYACEYRMRCKNGNYKWLLARGQVLWDEQGTPIRAVGSLTDISDRKQAEVEQKAQQAFLRQVIDVVPNVIFVKDREGRILSVNQAGATMHGTTVEAMIGKREPDFNPNFSIAQLDEFLAINRQVMQTRRSEQILTQSVMDATSERRWYQTVISPLIDVEGQVTGIVGATTDVTQLKQVEQALQQAKEAAEAANNAKSIFLANMSHELRTPLNVILGFAQTMSRDPLLTPEHRESLHLIRRSGDHLLNLINDVLDLSKIEAGHVTVDETSVDLLDLLLSLEQMFRQRVAAKGLQFHLDLAPDLPQYITTDANKLRQILINLLGNAIKFTHQGEIGLRVCPVTQTSTPSGVVHPPSSLYFEVKDTGVGIDLAELELIFQAFVQTQAGKISPDGTGLGLTISRKFVQMLGGDISVHSTLGQGSRFAFSLPMHLARSPDLCIPSTTCCITGLAPHQPTYRILVVDDQPENRKLLVSLLAPMGLEVREASNGQAAVAQWQEWQPHLIWMDIRMPVLNGYEATQQIRAMPGGHAPRIVALTGQASETDCALALAAGCNDYLTKPFQVEILFSKMAEHLGVRFLYTGEQSTLSGEERSGELNSSCITLQPSELCIMAPTWIAGLLQAANLCDDNEIERLIQQIPAEQEFLIKGLYQLAQSYDFAQLIHLASVALAHAKP